MKDSFRSSEDYELFLYTLQDQFSSIRGSTIVFVRRGDSLARASGEILFDQEFRLVVLERLLFGRLPLVIDAYGYEIWRGEEKLCWYDSQPHPDDETLQSTHPHHKHVPPDIKHNRIPAPGMSFDQPNTPTLIEEIEELIEATEKS
jgi:hypothetical protein